MMSVRRWLVTFVAVASVLSITGCGGQASSAEGTWRYDGQANEEQDLENQPHLTLHEDLSVSGFDGCNRLMGTWEQDGKTVEFGALASTRMYCEGVDTWLSLAYSATIDGNEMCVLDETGTHIGTLVHSSSETPNH